MNSRCAAAECWRLVNHNRNTSSIWMIVVVALLCVGTSSCSISPRFDHVAKIELVDFGEYKRVGAKRTTFERTRETQRVKLNPRVMFGLRFRIKTEGLYQCAEIAEFRIAPAAAIDYTPFHTWQRSWRHDDEKNAWGRRTAVCEGNIYWSGFYFRHDKKYAPGSYSIAIINASDEVLIEKTFEVFAE